MTRTTHILAPLLLLLLLVSPQSDWGQIRHEVFLANTDHELHVYRITGQEPGPTLMIIGGIQGDEPGSYLTADLYADIHLKRGNLIVVPRANLYSILLNRRNGLTGDMNRKFDDKVEKRNLEEEVVAILKHLIAESDCLLNLHEGSGFYNPKWINDMENPMRFGQSIIFDAAEYRVPGEERIIRLAEMADRIISRVNPQIDNPRYRFRPNNHDTLNPKTSHPEQRKSATYYALTRAHIPAFGVETSKSIRSLATKIHLHKLVINAVMADLGIILDTPGVNLEPPQLRYLLVQVGNGFPYALPDGARLEVAEGTDITVTDIIANYRRGLVADIEGLGSTNDNHKPFRITEPTRIIVRKDAQRCGLVEVVPRRPAAIEPAAPKAAVAAKPAAEKKRRPLQAETLLVDVDGTMRQLANGATLTVRRGARLTLHAIRTNDPRRDRKVVVNFKGFAPPKAVNDGNDLNFPIYTDQDLWKRYSVGKKGKRYPIVATYNDREIGKFWVELR